MNSRKLGFGWLGLAGLGVAAVALVAADPALAKPRNKANKAHLASACAPRPADLSFRHFWFAGEPVPNGCSPAVFEHGRFIGQDPDPNIRFQLMRQPETGYTITK